MYLPRQACRFETVRVRAVDYQLRLWGAPNATPVFLLHGWMDTSASFQFMVDALGGEFLRQHTLIAPDWRGFGQTTLAWPCDSFHFVDYLADLQALLTHYAPGQSVVLIGHSMGGNIAMYYAGVRPAQVQRVINLEGFGLPATQPEQAPARLAQWLDETRACAQGQMALQSYSDLCGVAQRLIKTNPRLTADKAHWLAQHWAQQGSDGRWSIRGHSAHKVVSAQLYRVEEAHAVYRAITAPVLSVQASEDSLARWWNGQYRLAEYHQRLAQVPRHTCAVVSEAGHMLHHDQPQTLAQLIEDFLRTD